MPPKKQIVTAEVAEDEEFKTFDEAYAHLMANLEPGGWIDLHEEHCALVDDLDECTCTPHRITKGAEA